MPVIGLPTTLDVFLNTSISQVGLSSYKIAANTHCTTVVLRFHNMADGQSLTRDYERQPPATWRKKSPCQRRRDQERIEKYKLSNKATNYRSNDITQSTPSQHTSPSNFFENSHTSSGFDESRSIFLSPCTPHADLTVDYQQCVKNDQTKAISNSTGTQNENNDCLHRSMPCSYNADNERDPPITEHIDIDDQKVTSSEIEPISYDSKQHVSNECINPKRSHSSPAQISTIQTVASESTHQSVSLQNVTSFVCKQTNEPDSCCAATDIYNTHFQHISLETDNDPNSPKCAGRNVHTESEDDWPTSDSDSESHTSDDNNNEPILLFVSKQYKDREDFLISCEGSTPESERNVCSSGELDKTRFMHKHFMEYTLDLPEKTKTRIKSNSRNCFFRRLKEKPESSQECPILLAETDDLIIEFNPNTDRILNFSVTTGELVEYEHRNIGAFQSLSELNPKQYPQQLAMLKTATIDLLRIIKRVLQ